MLWYIKEIEKSIVNINLIATIDNLIRFGEYLMRHYGANGVEFYQKELKKTGQTFTLDRRLIDIAITARNELCNTSPDIDNEPSHWRLIMDQLCIAGNSLLSLLTVDPNRKPTERNQAYLDGVVTAKEYIQERCQTGLMPPVLLEYKIAPLDDVFLQALFAAGVRDVYLINDTSAENFVSGERNTVSVEARLRQLQATEFYVRDIITQAEFARLQATLMRRETKKGFIYVGNDEAFIAALNAKKQNQTALDGHLLIIQIGEDEDVGQIADKCQKELQKLKRVTREEQQSAQTRINLKFNGAMQLAPFFEESATKVQRLIDFAGMGHPHSLLALANCLLEGKMIAEDVDTARYLLQVAIVYATTDEWQKVAIQSLAMVTQQITENASSQQTFDSDPRIPAHSWLRTLSDQAFLQRDPIALYRLGLGYKTIANALIALQGNLESGSSSVKFSDKINQYAKRAIYYFVDAITAAKDGIDPSRDQEIIPDCKSFMVELLPHVTNDEAKDAINELLKKLEINLSRSRLASRMSGGGSG